MSKSSQRVEGLTKALEQLEQLFGGSIGSPPGSPDDIRQALQRVDELAAGLTPADPAELRHFLERRSYVKALAFLRATAPQEPMV
jgi:hypothetical protein